MNSIIINYDPFGMESQILVTREGKTVGNTYSKSQLFDLAGAVVKSAHDFDVWTVYMRAPKVFYDQLNYLVSAQEKNLYSLNRIKMERI